MDSETQGFYEAEARRYREIHSRPLLRYSSELEQEFISPFLPSTGRTLDVGCGEGRTTRHLANVVKGLVVGADFSPAMVQQARYAADSASLFYCVADAGKLPFRENSFHVVTAMTTLNNVPDLRQAIAEAARVLVPGGVLIATVINSAEAARFVRGIYFGPYYLYRWLRGNRSGMIRRIYSREQLLEAVPPRLEVLSCEGMRVVPDFLPEYPFNFWPALHPAAAWTYGLLRPLDVKLSRHPITGRFARFHLLIARKR